MLAPSLNFASATGVHGSGQKLLFSLVPYLDSAATLLRTNIVAVVIFLLCSVLGIYALLHEEGRFKKLALIMLTFSLGGIIFAKFPFARYQITNYLVVTFGGSILFSRLFSKFVYILIFVLLILSLPVANKYLESITQMQNKTIYLENFIKDNPSQYATAWEWAPTKEFAYLWGLDFADGIFNDEVSSLPIKLFEFKRESVKIEVLPYVYKDIYDVCWDKLYIQKAPLEPLLKLYPQLSMSVQEIPKAGIFLINSNHCQNNIIKK